MNPRLVRRVAVVVAAAALALAPEATAVQPSAEQDNPWHPDIKEVTISSVHQAFTSGDLTCVALVRSYLQRIRTYDEPRGHRLATNAIQSLNRHALRKAARLDAAFARRGLTGPLHCIPVLVKDHVETKDMPTTYGSKIFQGFESQRDATIVSRMRDAGAIILAKTNMGEFASGWAGSAFGVCRNPYDLTRPPSSSSCGTGAGIASNYATVGIGGDTGGSTRGPGAWTNLVGLRPTTPLISRHGTLPAMPSFDTLGPLTRTVKDAALLTNVIAGYDPHDPLTADARGKVADDYADDLNADDLAGKRIGVLREPMDPDTDPEAKDYARVRAVVDSALNDMEMLGAEVIDPIEVPGVARVHSIFKAADAEREEAIDSYLAELDDPPVTTFREIATSPVITPTRQEALRNALGRTTRDPAYLESLQDRATLRQAVLDVMAKHNLDAIVYATFDHEPPIIPHDQLTNPDALQGVRQGDNRKLAPVSGLPALSVPAGFTTAGLPVGIDLLGRPFAEEQLFELAYAYEQATQHRKPPSMSGPGQPQW